MQTRGRYWRGLMSSPLVRNVMAVASGTMAGQVVVFAFAPLITRIYSPETFGLQGVFLSLISILSPAIALRYPMAIVVADSEDDAGRLSRLAIMIAFILSSLLGILLLFAQGPVLVLLGAEALGSLIWFLPLALFCVALQEIADFRAARAGSFRLVGIVTVLQAFLTNLARVLGGLVAPFAGVLVAVTSIAPLVQAALLSSGRRETGASAPGMLREEAVALLRRHRDFPLYRVPTDVLNAASQAVPVIMLAALFSPAAAGLYTLTRSVLNLPSNVISAAIGNVLYAHYAELARAGRPLMPLLLRTTAGLLALAPVIIGGAWFAPALFAFVFGEEWREAGHYAQWMALWVGISIANVPAIRLAPVIHAQNLLLVASLLILVFRVLAMLAVFWSGQDATTAVAVFSLVSLVTNAGQIVMIVLATRRYEVSSKGRSAAISK